jgi:hypothetical protein
LRTSLKLKAFRVKAAARATPSNLFDDNVLVGVDADFAGDP